VPALVVPMAVLSSFSVKYSYPLTAISRGTPKVVLKYTGPLATEVGTQESAGSPSDPVTPECNWLKVPKFPNASVAMRSARAVALSANRQ